MEGTDHKRPCAGCRQETRIVDLERFVFHPTVGLTYDMRGGAPGEEAYVHPAPACLDAALWTGFRRRFQDDIGDVELEELVTDVRRGIERRIVERLTDASRDGALVWGDEQLRAAKSSELELVALPESREREAYDGVSEEVAVFQQLSASQLGEPVGQSTVEAVGLPPGERAEAVGRDFEKLICLDEYEG